MSVISLKPKSEKLNGLTSIKNRISKNQRDFVENGYSFSEDVRKKMAKSAKGNTNSKGKKRSPTACENIGNSKKGNTFRRGTVTSD